MDGTKGHLQKKQGVSDDANILQYDNGVSLILSDENDLEGILNNEKQSNFGDLTFCMANYVKEAMKMMFMMRSHHMLTDVILEVGSELFHAHKVILAAASPYFKVNIQKAPPFFHVLQFFDPSFFTLSTLSNITRSNGFSVS